MKINIFLLAALCFTLAGAFVLPGPVSAQTATFPDVSENHWAYQAVTDLANKGYVKGYPNGKFLGGRTLTRFEFATVIDRMVQELDDLTQKVAQGQQPTTPTGVPVTQDDLNKIQALVDSFKDQLAAIQSTVATNQAQFQSEIDKLRSELATVKNEADNSYGAGPGRKYAISGYVQARYIQSSSGSSKDFPQGQPTPSSPVNGNYAAGGNDQSFLVRRARLRVNGQIDQNSAYAVQIDLSGFATNTPSATSNSSNAAVSAREAWLSYTLGNGDISKYPSFEAGQFPNPFGYYLPLSTAAMLTPERPLAFNEGSAGLFANDDYDRGVMVSYNPALLRFVFAVVNGTGLVSNDESHTLDQIYKAGIHSKDNVLSGDVSYYYGHLQGAGVGPTYVYRKKDLWDVDAQVISPSGPFVLGEYIAGKYEQRGFEGETAATSTNPFGFGVADAPGNNVKGYYVQGGWTWSATGSHPFSLFSTYDTFNRSDSGVAASVLGGASGSSFDDVNWGYGAIYNLDKAVRLRLYYIKPTEVAHAAGTAAPPNIGLTTAEVQVKF